MKFGNTHQENLFCYVAGIGAWHSLVCCPSLPVFACFLCLGCSECQALVDLYGQHNPKSVSQHPCINYKFYPTSKGFDMTLGFPGEGPWSVLSANVDSIHSHPHVYEWSHDLLCLQETRISSNNVDFPKKQFSDKGFDLFPGKLLKLRSDKNGTHRVPHGGVACAASQHLCKPFTEDQDETGLWGSLFETSRVCAVWVQVQPKVRALCFSFYGQTHHENGSFFDFNNDFLEKLLLICSQFGEIPILISGDFQLEPGMYPAVAKALVEDHWTDPLSANEPDGSSSRPLTYSRNGNFKNPQDNCSSIDGILVNRIALTALASVEVCGNDGRQHAPLCATFNWPKLLQTGFKLEKPAAIRLDTLPRKGDKIDVDLIEMTAVDLWHWTRGRFPKVKKVRTFPGQERDGGAATTLSAKLSKLHKLVVELRHRISRPATKTADMHITWKLQNKVAQFLKDLKVCSWWSIDTHLDDDSLFWVLKHVQEKIVIERSREKRQRISRWKEKMIHGTTSKNVSCEVYKWIKQKNQHIAANLILGPDGNIIYSPDEAIKTINNQWDDIFASNILHEEP